MCDMCVHCRKPLGYNKTIFAAEGKLYCSEACGLKAYKNVNKLFVDYAEEITPSSVGIMPPRKYVITGTDRKGKRFKPIYTDNPRHYNIWCGSLWRVLPDGKRQRIGYYGN